MNTKHLLAARLISTALFNLVGVLFHIIFGTVGLAERSSAPIAW